VKEQANVHLAVFDICGRLMSTLVDQVLDGPARYRVRWDARGQASGVYLVRMIAQPSGSGAPPLVRTTRMM